MRKLLITIAMLSSTAMTRGAGTASNPIVADAQQKYDACVARANAEYARILAAADKSYLAELDAAIRVARRQGKHDEANRLQALCQGAREAAREHQAIGTRAEPLAAAERPKSDHPPFPADPEKTGAISPATRAALPTEEELHHLRDVYRANLQGEKNENFAILGGHLVARLDQDGENWTDPDAASRWEAQCQIWKAEETTFSNDNIVGGFVKFAAAAPDTTVFAQRVQWIEEHFAGSGNPAGLNRARLYAEDWFARHPENYKLPGVRLTFCESLRKLCKEPAPLEQYMRELDGPQQASR